jgi:hypothetical protein
MGSTIEQHRVGVERMKASYPYGMQSMGTGRYPPYGGISPGREKRDVDHVGIPGCGV